MADLVTTLAAELTSRGLMLSTAESCTGGLVAAACTDVAGSSVWFDRGFVTYSNAAKHEMLGVPLALIEQHGAVSEAVAGAMALGAFTERAVLKSQAQVAISITGIAGPGGGSLDKPVGTVCFGWVVANQSTSQCKTETVLLTGDRVSIRMQATHYALCELLRLLKQNLVS